MEKLSRRARALLSGAIASALAPVAGAQVNQAFNPPPVDLSSLRNIRIVLPQQTRTISAFPLNSPPINGFIPSVIVGLTSEQDRNDFNGTSVASSSPGGQS